MNGKVGDAAVGVLGPLRIMQNAHAALIDQADALLAEAVKQFNVALEAAKPAKPEAVRLRDELRERAEFEDWYAQNAFDYVAAPIGSRDCVLSWKAWQAALAATGKQQVGEVQGSND